jgi:hypothetical protein
VSVKRGLVEHAIEMKWTDGWMNENRRKKQEKQKRNVKVFLKKTFSNIKHLEKNLKKTTILITSLTTTAPPHDGCL